MITVWALVTTIIMFFNDGLDRVSVYPQTTIVTEVDYKSDLVTISTFTGVEYQFYGCEDWYVGDICSVIFCDNGTSTIYDDIIISTRYSGYIENENWQPCEPLQIKECLVTDVVQY